MKRETFERGESLATADKLLEVIDAATQTGTRSTLLVPDQHFQRTGDADKDGQTRNELNARATRARIDFRDMRDFFAQYPTQRDTNAAIARHAGQTLITKEELAELKQLRGEWLKANEVKIAHGSDKASEKFRAQRKALLTAAADGKAAKTEDREEIEKEFYAIRKAAKQVQKDVCAKAIPLIERVMRRFAGAADSLAKRISDEERDLFQKFAITPYREGPVAMTVRAAAFRAVDRVPPIGTSFDFITTFDGVIDIEKEAR